MGYLHIVYLCKLQGIEHLITIMPPVLLHIALHVVDAQILFKGGKKPRN